MRRLKIILELFSNPEYRVELSVVLFLLIGLSLTILVHQITLGGVEDLLASDMKSTQYYERNLEELQNLNDHLSDLDTELNVYIFNNDLLKEATIRAHIEQINKGLDRIGANLSGNAEEKRQFNSINQFVKQKIVLSEAILRRYNTQNVQRAKDLLLNQEQWSKQLIDSIEHISTNLRVLQQNNLKANITSHQQFIGNARRVEFVTTIIVFAIVSISILYLLRETSQRLHLQEKLAFAKEEAERSARIKEQFMANMSHEIRTPLNAIVGFTNLLKNTPLNARQQEYVESMRYSGENLIAIVNDILDLSKMEAEMTKLEEVPFHFKELLHNLEALFRYRAEEKGIDFQFIVDAEIPDQLIGDPNRLMQIFTNLLNNAIKFTDQGEVTLRATLTEKEADQSALICVEVQDTGIGIPKNQLHKVFERFSQDYSDSTRKYGGAGLGLTIVKYLIELLNGTIKVESEEGAGTKFTVSLPFLISTDMQAQPFPSPTTNVDNKQFSFKPSKILMVEDNPMNRRVIELLLDSWELQLEQAENGKQALELVRQNQYDLILMDIQMPELDGIIRRALFVIN
ncbi:MAG: ATP-binding protein [Saprospiraceae bacterium]